MTTRFTGDKMSLTIERALLSVSDKRHIVSLAEGLESMGCSLLSTGGTGQVLLENDVSFTRLSTYTGFPEIMDGRVKTLHPLVHGGILSRRELDADVVEQQGIAEIDLVVVNLYPFVETISVPACTREQAIENIDIGGPAMIRAAAKNHRHVLVVVEPDDYEEVLERMKNKTVDDEYRQAMAAKAFRHTAAYDAQISDYLEERETFPETLNLALRRQDFLRYGENPHQRAAFYVREPTRQNSIAAARQIQGKRLSYNNIADADAAYACVQSFNEPACTVVKHGNPCGVAIGSDSRDAYLQAFATDPTSAYGGIIAFNESLDAEALKAIIEKQFAEVIVAPAVASEAIELAKRRKNLRILEMSKHEDMFEELHVKQVSGGLLVQEFDSRILDSTTLKCVTERQPTEREREDLDFAWRVALFVKSNAIVMAKNQRTVGIGAGQMSRVVSAKVASMKATEEGLDLCGCALASDAYFPFRDGLDFAAQNGVTAVIQPGGSIRDEEVIEAANEHGIAMLFTGIRHFRH